jgi:hypothetical protein
MWLRRRPSESGELVTSGLGIGSVYLRNRVADNVDDDVIAKFLAEREAERHREMRSLEAPYETWHLVRDQQVRAVDWTAMRDRLGEMGWRTYIGLRHELPALCYPRSRKL